MIETHIDELSSEVDKIIASPYPVALKNLHNIVAICDNVSIRKWVDTHRLQIPALATAMLEGIPLWPCTLDLIAAFSQVRCFRDACLHESPTILNDLLNTTLQTKKGFERASAACISFLTHPLPPAVALPSSAQDFLTRLFERAVRQPSPETVKPVYIVISGGCAELLELLPAASLSRFRENLFMLMKKDKKGEEQLLTLLSLSILGKIRDNCITPRPVGSTSTALASDTSLTTSMSEEDRKEINKYFSGEWAHKTTTLVVLQCIRACGSEPSVTVENARYRLQLAREIMYAVDSASREEWVQDNPRYLQKLTQKATQPNLDPLLKLEATSIISAFGTTDDLTESLVDSFESAFLNSLPCLASVESLRSALQSSILKMASKIKQSFWHMLTLAVITQVCEHQTKKSTNPDAWIALNSDLKDLVFRSPAVRLGIIQALCSNELTAPMNSFYAIEHRSAATEETIKLEESVLALLFAVSIQSQKGEIRLPQDSLEQMLQKQRQLVLAPRPAPLSLYRTEPQNPIIEHPTGTDRPSSCHWKESLIAELDTRAKDCQTAVTRLLARTCEDLELRCKGIEEPLQRMKEERDTLQDQNEDINSQLQRLKDAHGEQESEISALRQDLSQFEAKSKDASSVAEEHEKTIEDLEMKLENFKHDRDQEVSGLRVKYNQQDLELRATIACQVEQINDQQSELNKLKEDLTYQMKGADDASEQAQSKQNALSESLAAAQQSLASEQKANTEIRQEIEQLTHNERALQTKITALAGENERLSTRANGLDEEVMSLKKSHEQTLKSVRELHEREVQFISEQAESTQTKMRQHLEKMEYELDCIQSAQANGLRKKNNRIKELQDKLQRLAKELNEKSAQLLEAQALKNNLLSTLGFNAGSSKDQTIELPKKGLSDRRQQLDSDDIMQDLAKDDIVEASEIEEGNQPFESEESASSTSITGPTPKRVRPSKPFKLPTRDSNFNMEGNAREPSEVQSMFISKMPLQESRPRHLNRRSESILNRNKFNKVPEQRSRQTQLFTAAGSKEPNGSDEENQGLDNWDNEQARSAQKKTTTTTSSNFGDLRTQDFESTTVEL